MIIPARSAKELAPCYSLDGALPTLTARRGALVHCSAGRNLSVMHPKTRSPVRWLRAGIIIGQIIEWGTKPAALGQHPEEAPSSNAVRHCSMQSDVSSVQCAVSVPVHMTLLGRVSTHSDIRSAAKSAREPTCQHCQYLHC